MTAKVIMVLVVFNVLVTEAASASGTHSEADGCTVIPAAGGSEPIQSCSDSTSLLQAQVRTHPEEGGETREVEELEEQEAVIAKSLSKTRAGKGSSARRRGGPICQLPATEGMTCGNSKITFQAPDTCFPGCKSGLAVSGDTKPRSSISCNNGALSSTPDWTCVDATAKGKLTVTVIKASGLEDEDWWSGESDPYVIVKLNGEQCDSCKTATVQDNDNPSWNHEISLDISSMNDELTFDVWDKDDAAMDDFLGQTHREYQWEFNAGQNAKVRKVIQEGSEKTIDFKLYNGWSEAGTLTVKLKFQA